MKSLIIPGLACVALFIWIADTRLSWRPFKVSMPSIWLAVGWLIVAIGLGFVNFHYRQQGRQAGIKSVTDTMIRALNEKINQDSTQTPQQ